MKVSQLLSELLNEASVTTYEAVVHDKDEPFPVGYNGMIRGDSVDEINSKLKKSQRVSRLTSFTRNGAFRSKNDNVSHDTLDPLLACHPGFYAKSRQDCMAGPYPSLEALEEAIEKHKPKGYSVTMWEKSGRQSKMVS